ncbi:MAG: DNA polymerase Y family protein [Acidimicrobiales bacterium]
MNIRSLVVVCPDWPVIATAAPADEPVAVIVANRVTATSPAARAEGVEVGLRRREAQRRCPGLQIVDPEPDRDARVFASIAALVDRFTPRVELSSPGCLAFPTLGPSRYFGGDEQLALLVAADIDDALHSAGWANAVGIGVADGLFAATRAAEVAITQPHHVHVVSSGDSANFLAPFSVSALARPELADVLQRLGLRRLGDFASLKVDDVVARFGIDGRLAHRLAHGLDDRPSSVSMPQRSFDVTATLDPPAERVDTAAFAARTAAEELHEQLGAEGLACTRLRVVIETDVGERLERIWRHEGALSSNGIVDRVRWQLDGWLNGPSGQRPNGGVTRLLLAPEEVLPARGRQHGFWGGETEADERAGRALARVQAMVGVAAVTVPERRGGRSPADVVVRVPFVGIDGGDGQGRDVALDAPWPGRVPSPLPALLPTELLPIQVLDAKGALVWVSGRGTLSAEPSMVRFDDAARGGVSIAGWAGPWPCDERWWDQLTHRRRARLQLVLVDGRALLVQIEQGSWSVEAIYD